MSSPIRRRSAKAVIAATGFGLVVTPLALPSAAFAAPDGSNVVISEVYGAGGNTGAAFNTDYVELYNPTTSAISLSGMSVQYRSATGTANPSGVIALTGSIPSHGHYLVGGATGANGAAIPTPNASNTGVNLSGTTGTVFLANQTTALNAPPTGSVTANASIADLVGFGTSNTFEGSVAPAPSSANSIARNATGADTDVNSADFTAGTGTPENAVEPPPEEFTGSIAEIQGTDAVSSPHEGDIATTSGVVTAAYPTGGYNGFYIQTPGTGDAADETPGASDAIFVYGSAATGAVKIGDYVEVTGPVKEFNGTTEIETDAASDVVPLTGSATAPTPLATALPATEAAREAHEGELIAPSGPFTVTNTYTTNSYAEIGLAAGTTPLVAPTEVEDAQTGDIAGVTADNAARAITLDDGSSASYTSGAKNTPMPWLSRSNPVRVGAPVTFTGPVVLEYRNNLWKFQPTSQITGDGSSTATFANTRTDAPVQVGGDLRIATFNVLNYFPTTGKEFVDSGLGTCTYYNDRAGNPITVNSCTPNGPRGAANAENLQRQQDKIVTAINKLGASIVSLEEIENSVQFGKDRDFAVGRLVDALNNAAGAGTWAYAPSPAPADLPTPAQEDVIRTAFIYKPAEVALVGGSKVLIDEENFDNAREPLAQAFKKAGTSDRKAFAVIVNHFKSKGSGADDGTGQGLANADRVGQAKALSAFADSFATERKLKAVFLAGDFNSYSMEDPMQVLYGDGYTAVESDTKGEETYSFSGLSGSLDHVLANDAAFALVNGADIWNINSPESVGFEYSRYNNNATDLYAPDQYRASDHDPEIVGINASQIGLKKIQVLATNDFHGRIANNPSGAEAGAAVLAGAVKQLRGENPDTVFAAAGDLIGASTFESFIAHDKPTIDALNSAGLEVSSVGNHEFDQGYDDLVNRVMAPYDAETNPYGGAQWKYIAANVHKPGAPESELLDPTYVKDFGDVEVGFIGAVTEHLNELVSPDGIRGVEVEDIVTATNREADALKAAGVDVVVLLVHEGAATTAYDSAVDPTSDFGRIVDGVDEDVDAIVSGHTHLAYNHAVPVKAWTDEGRAVTERPVVSAGQYGTNLNQLVFTVDSDTGDVVAQTQKILALKTGQTANYPVDAATKSIVDAAVADASVLGAKRIGDIAGPFNRAKVNGKDANGNPILVENRGGESTAGNLVAEVQRWATESTTSGSAQIAFMNPGGLRQDLVGTGTTYPRPVSYKQAAEVQPFANTLVNMRLTGARIKSVLEQQWQPAGASRPFLKLGMSKGFSYTYDPAAPAGSRITGMWLNGDPVDSSATYSVTANSFLAAGGDNFTAFRDGTDKRDTGKVDLQAMVDYMATFADATPLTVDYHQQAVGVSFPSGAPAEYAPGDEVAFKLSSLAFSTAADTKDAEVQVSLGNDVLGTFPVDNTIGSAVYDEYGTADVKVALPAGTPDGKAVLTVTGVTTGSSVPVTVTVADPRLASSTSAKVAQGTVVVKRTKAVVLATVTVGDAPATGGTVEVYEGTKRLGAGEVADGEARVQLPPFDSAGRKTLTVKYLGTDTVKPSATTVEVEVVTTRPRE
ncbi:MAG TPA: ExeM/NucH family extracellular endonuclease [Nocardioidaceae bacterium]